MKHSRTTRATRFAACSAALIIVAGCASLEVRLKSNAAGHAFAQTPDDPEFAQTESLVGIGERVVLVEDTDPGTGEVGTLHSVVIRNNFFYDLIGVATLGLWRPLEVEYYLTRRDTLTQDP